MSFSQKLTVWRLKKGQDRRFKSGHPWVYSNELQDSPKGLPSGAPVELRDASGKFLARGYGNPHSLIAFRVLTRNPEITNPQSPDRLLESLVSAGNLRSQLGLSELSHRLCFGEADYLPGLVIDRYRTVWGQVFVVQAHTAGADRWMDGIVPVLEKYVSDRKMTPKVDWKATSVVFRNDLGVRKLEGLEEETPKVAYSGASTQDLSDAKIRVRSAHRSIEFLEFYTDLKEGQKTGFFLDQSANIELAWRRLLEFQTKRELRILDLFSYVGQWSTQLSHAISKAAVRTHVVTVDASAKALEFARRNLNSVGANVSVETVKADALKDLSTLKEGSFDVVICDPPALIKSRKDIPVGSHAYLQLNSQAFNLLKKGGAVISCSCSALLEEEKFLEVLSKGAQRNHKDVRWVARGCQAPDHPLLTEFPEGRYLKAYMGFATEVNHA